MPESQYNILLYGVFTEYDDVVISQKLLHIILIKCKSTLQGYSHVLV